jgi:NADH-ubiquinone oxidoreductase chain 6
MILVIIEIFLFFLLRGILFLQQPLSIGRFLLLYCFFLRIIIYSFFSSWFSFSLFLIYIGGILVLFGYILVLIPNFVFAVSYISFFFFFFFLFYFFPLGEVREIFFEFSFSFFSYYNIIIYLFLRVILFIGLVSVVKICFFQVGALRPFFLFYV